MQIAANCLGLHVTLVRAAPPGSGPTRLHLERGFPVALAGTSFLLRYHQAVLPVHESRRDWWAVVSAYSATFFEPNGRELIAFHWHPSGASHVKTPHAHAALRTDERRLAGGHVHIPTPELAIAAIVRFAIEELGATPARPDWQSVLDA